MTFCYAWKGENEHSTNIRLHKLQCCEFNVVLICKRLCTKHDVTEEDILRSEGLCALHGVISHHFLAASPFCVLHGGILLQTWHDHYDDTQNYS